MSLVLVFPPVSLCHKCEVYAQTVKKEYRA